jgi:hypothetical protein
MPLVIEFYVFKRQDSIMSGIREARAEPEINIALQKNSKHV